MATALPRITVTAVLSAVRPPENMINESDPDFDHDKFVIGDKRVPGYAAVVFGCSGAWG